MPLFPTIEETRIYQQATAAFRGYNHTLTVADGEFYDMENLTSSYYPVLSPRGKRGVYAASDSLHGIIAKNELCYIDGADFVIGSQHIDMGLRSSEKTLTSIGAYVIIMPDKKYINTEDITDFGDIEATVTTVGAVTFALCDIGGAEYTVQTVSPTAPVSPANMEYWIDTSSVPHTLKQWSELNATWVTVATTYVKISGSGIGSYFSTYDGVDISGITSTGISELNGSHVLYSCGNDYIVITGLIDAVTTETAPITVARLMPEMDFITESNNRLWGCKYGTARNGETVNEIYACKLGDFRNWNCFMGISTDSYIVSCGTDGQFTGAVTHLGYPIFFKENCLHKIYGSYPSNYQVQTTTCRGVQSGCEKSLAIVNEILYYKSRSSVCAYDGSLPVEIGKAFGEAAYSSAVAGAFGDKYYISMKDNSNAWQLFVYDAAKGMWHREDNTHASAFCSFQGEMYFIADGKIHTVLGSGIQDTTPVHWIAESGVIGIVEDASYPARLQSHRYISRLVARMALALGSKVSFYIQYDSFGEWEYLFTMNGTSLKSFSVPIRPKRCDHFRLRIVGDGEAKIYSIVKSIEWGSDMP